MRILVTIPHYFRPTGSEPVGRHQSQTGDPNLRAAALKACIESLFQLFGPHQSMIQIAERKTQPANQPYHCELHVVVCTVGARHVLENAAVETRLFQHFPVDVDPLLLGFECHQILRDRWGNYDYYCYMEDDLILHDSWFFAKLTWFNHHVGQEKLLQPNRFERSSGPRDQRVYVDGDLAAHVTQPFQDVQDEPVLQSNVMNTQLEFRRTLNPHAGCFFLNAQQMQHWINQPYFLDRSKSFVGPLETAATLGIMRAFKVYKPAPHNANFLEVEHYGTQFRDRIWYK